ncbi:hypothetical protein [Bosea sp. ANAM02]|uniref:hypothetical protein n=1 Tax=Bosea sp. ANAM02 TaxID=2020412 RepID=UPI000647C125|nr:MULTISPECIES: hypothetical protein [Hyphomicrobiales]BCB19674.1 hypothetical protein OCUBac02_25680 [Bosea sp. ANAM02]
MRRPAKGSSVLPPRPDFDALGLVSTRRSSPRRLTFMTLAGDLNLAWSNDESLFIYLLMLLLRTDERAAAIVFATLNTTRARLDLVQRLAKIAPLEKAVRGELNDIVERFSAATRLRNDLSHATFVIDAEGEITHTQHMKVEESRGNLRFGLRKPVDDDRLEEIARMIQDLHALNRRIWDLMPVLEAAMTSPEK